MVAAQVVIIVMTVYTPIIGATTAAGCELLFIPGPVSLFIWFNTVCPAATVVTVPFNT